MAAAAGDARRVESLLRQGRDANERDSFGWTALHTAARNGHVRVIEALLAGGADPDLPDTRNRWTPLMHAIHKHQDQAARALIAAGADVRDGSGSTPVRTGTTPLMMAAGYGNTEIVRLLLERGADPRVEIGEGRSALWAAVGGGAIADITDGPPLGTCFPETVDALLRKAPDLALKGDVVTRLTRWLARSARCRQLLDRIDRGPTSRSAFSGNGARP
jgi:hypothetical protein